MGSFTKPSILETDLPGDFPHVWLRPNTGNEAPPPFNSSSIHRLVAQQDVQPPTDASVGVRPSCDLLQVIQDPPDPAKPRDSGLRPTALGTEQTQASHRERIPPSHAPR